MKVSSGDMGVSARLSPLKGAALGLLVQRPSYGYEIANLLERQLGPNWSVVRPSLYRMLKKLETQGILSSVSSRETSLARIVYSATDLAEVMFVGWMESPLPFEQGQLQLQARMVVARREDLPRLLVALNNYERALFAKRLKIQADLPPRKSLRSTMMFLVREAHIQQIAGELLWVDTSRKTIRDLMAS